MSPFDLADGYTIFGRLQSLCCHFWGWNIQYIVLRNCFTVFRNWFLKYMSQSKAYLPVKSIQGL